MTDRKYKLVPAEPYPEMVYAASLAFDLRKPDAMRNAIMAATNATPEPVCMWTWSSIDGFWDCGCGNQWVFTDGAPADNDCNFCPHCGKKVEVVGDE